MPAYTFQNSRAQNEDKKVKVGMLAMNSAPLRVSGWIEECVFMPFQRNVPSPQEE
jgi:hypothetical protein